ncbi:YcbK family protein [Edaphobacter sp.]|uniref:YcbK family protein n=1 Tax=Edaphobacter sp. TaxID=1934404 RepID=UPI002DBAABC7|nr:DUF882 domain-containing protein [Edaphobacter sp.]HEU5340010.1 DUF882 domain-containing protein [Edaphobacter sp.]
MRFLGRTSWTLVIAMVLTCPAWAGTPAHRATSKRVQHHRLADAAASMSAEATSLSDQFRLRLQNLHTGENLNIVYRIGDTYIPEALDKLNYFLRDHNTDDVISYDPKEFDVLHQVMQRLHRPNGVIDIVCGYRTPETNEALRESSPRSGVAEHSQHMEGHAVDIRVPGVSTARLRNAALSLHEGGVGYYPVSHFVHVDVGPVRQWTFGRAPRRRVYRHRSRMRVGE